MKDLKQKITVDDLRPKYRGKTVEGFAIYEIPFFGIGFSSKEKQQKFIDDFNNSEKFESEKLPWAK